MSCPLCDTGYETLQHLLVDCGDSFGGWSFSWKWCRINGGMFRTVKDIMNMDFVAKGTKWKMKTLRGILMVSYWVIWNERNKKVFQDNITEDITVGIKFKPVVSSSLKPVEGMIFPSLDASYQFYVEYANKGRFSVRKGTQTEKNGFIQYKYFICSKEGSKPQKKFDSLEEVHQGKKQKKCRNMPSIRTGCLAQIALCTVDGGKSYKINKFIEEHNHILVSQEDMHFLPSSRNLTVMQQKRLYSLSTLNLGPVKSFNILRTEYGGFDDVGVTAADCKNFKRTINCYIGEFDAEMIVQRLLNKKEYFHDFSFDYTVDESGCFLPFYLFIFLIVKHFTFPFILILFVHRYKMVFVPFTGIDNHFRNVNLGAGLIAKETIESYTWLLTCFLKAFGRQPKVVVTDQDPAMKQAIESVFTESRHRLCMWHIMKKIADKVSIIVKFLNRVIIFLSRVIIFLFLVSEIAHKFIL
ncbi:protein FAR1-RELATED SEQUENCE 5-like [Bidens hawaiensis]|uniref:protein FAR1-RELATED SEQUENCE 5-like n=1 Tax=Bidens hawaiensis TaxID=980011 RepID=UPI004049DEB5